MKTDAELIRAARTDAGAFRELYDRYAGKVHRYHLRRTRDSHAAHDLTAETFAQAWISRGRYRDEANGSAGPWLFAIARHVLAQSVRRRRLERAACERLGVMDRLDREPSTLEPDAFRLTTSAESRFAASSNDELVRVDDSKKTVMTVRPRRVGTFFRSRCTTDSKLSAVARMRSTSSRSRSATEIRWRRGCGVCGG